MKTYFSAIFWLLAMMLPVLGADVEDVTIARNADGSFHIAVTVSSDETGWDKYADKWEVLGPDGTVLGTRILHHPHVNEQPFTRSLPALGLPPQITTIRVRAHDSVEGFVGAEQVVPVP